MCWICCFMLFLFFVVGATWGSLHCSVQVFGFEHAQVEFACFAFVVLRLFNSIVRFWLPFFLARSFVWFLCLWPRYLDDLLDLGTRWWTDACIALSLRIALDSHRFLDFECLDGFSDFLKECRSRKRTKNIQNILLAVARDTNQPRITVKFNENKGEQIHWNLQNPARAQNVMRRLKQHEQPLHVRRERREPSYKVSLSLPTYLASTPYRRYPRLKCNR